MKRFSFLFLAFGIMLLSACGTSTTDQEVVNDYDQNDPYSLGNSEDLQGTQDEQDPQASYIQDDSQDDSDTLQLEDVPEKTDEINPSSSMSDKFDQTALPQSGEQIVVIETSKGTVKLRLFPEFAPKTVENFIKLAEEGFYDGLTFHRVIKGFMIQGGDPEGTGGGGPGYTVPAEITDELVHLQGALATARLPDQINPNKDSSGSQFYIVHGDARFLDGEYTVFGQLFEGTDVVDAIANVQTGLNDKPVEDVIMEKVFVENY